MTPRTLAEWLEFQQHQHSAGIALGLDRVAGVWQRLGARRPAPCVITVGGTNGKGTTVAMLESMLRAAGKRIGAYTSPHLIRYTERLRIDGEELDAAAWVKVFARIESVRDGMPMTYFEFGTLAALELMADAGVDVALLEVGLGGRLDAVNIVDADAAIVISVDLDHMEYLGPDRDSIGREKAGIFRAGRPAILGDREPPRGLLDAAAGIGADLHRLGVDFDIGAGMVARQPAASGQRAAHAPSPQPSPPMKMPLGERGQKRVDAGLQPSPPSQFEGQRDAGLQPSLPSVLGGEGWVRGQGSGPPWPTISSLHWHAAGMELEVPALALDAPGRPDNAAAALAALHALRDRLGWPQTAYLRGLAEFTLPARAQRIAGPPEVIVDVAHNPHAARALAAWLQRHPARGRTLAVFSALADKDIPAIGAILGPHVACWYLCALADAGSRSLDAAEVARRLRQGWPGADCTLHAGPPQAFAAARAVSGVDDRILAFGSFHLAGSVLAAIGPL